MRGYIIDFRLLLKLSWDEIEVETGVKALTACTIFRRGEDASKPAINCLYTLLSNLEDNLKFSRPYVIANGSDESLAIRKSIITHYNWCFQKAAKLVL